MGWCGISIECEVFQINPATESQEVARFSYTNDEEERESETFKVLIVNKDDPRLANTHNTCEKYLSNEFKYFARISIDTDRQSGSYTGRRYVIIDGTNYYNSSGDFEKELKRELKIKTPALEYENSRNSSAGEE